MEKYKEDIESQTQDILDIYKKSADVLTFSEYNKILAALKPETYQKVEFSEKRPNEAELKEELFEEAGQNVNTAAFWKRNKLKEEYVVREFNNRYPVLCKEWEDRKAAHDYNEAVREANKNAAYMKEYELKKKHYIDLIDGYPKIIEDALDDWLSGLELPVDFNVQYEYKPDKNAVLLDLDLPEIEDMPTQKAWVYANGYVKSKNKTQKEIKYDYMCCVYGLAIFFASHVFNVSPAIESVTVSGYTQRRNKYGDIADDYIYSVKFKRSLFETEDLCRIDVLDFWDKFENRCLLTQTYEFKNITPYE